MASGAAFGDALGIPVHGVCSHDAIARRLPAGRALVATDARRREIYWATYDDGVRTTGPGVDKPAELAVPHDVDVISVPGHLAAQLPEALQDLPRHDLAPTPRRWWPSRSAATPEPLVPLPAPPRRRRPRPCRSPRPSRRWNSMEIRRLTFEHAAAAPSLRNCSSR